MCSLAILAFRQFCRDQQKPTKHHFSFNITQLILAKNKLVPATTYIPPSECCVEGWCLVRERSYLSISIVSSLTSSSAPGCALWQVYQRRWGISLLTLASRLQPGDSYTQLYTIITEGSLSSYSYAGDPMCGADSGYSDINTLPILSLQYRQHRAAQVLFCYSVCVHVQRSVVWWQHRGGDITAILRRYYGHKAAVPAAHRSPAPRCLIGRFYWRKCGVT